MRATRLVAGLLLTAVTASLTVACSADPAPAKAPTQHQVQELLDGLGKDVLSHRATAFLAGIDSSRAAASFRAQQRTDITNLAGVPLASWSYRIESVVHTASVLAAATKEFGTPASVVQVSVSYALRYVDPLPTSHDLWLTVIERGGKTYLAADDALVTAGFPSWVGPWRFGPLTAVRGRSSLVLGPPTDINLLHTLADEVDAAVPAVTAVWGRSWARQVAVIVPYSEAEFTDLVGSGSSITDTEAAAATDGIDPGSGRAYGQRLVLNPAALATLTTVGRGIVLRHEITHLATAASTADITPRWLIEGFAEYVGNLHTGQSVATAAQELHALVRAGKLPTQLPGDAAFTGGSVAVAQAYEESWLACRLIAARAGQAGLVRFYRLVGTALEPAAPALTAALRTVVHLSPAEFVAAWRVYVQTQLP
jgi:hypothetical protein